MIIVLALFCLFVSVAAILAGWAGREEIRQPGETAASS